MSPNSWQRRVLHAEGPNATAGERTIEQCAVSAADVGLYGLALVRHGLGEPRVVAKLSAGCCLRLQVGQWRNALRPLTVVRHNGSLGVYGRRWCRRVGQLWTTITTAELSPSAGVRAPSDGDNSAGGQG